MSHSFNVTIMKNPLQTIFYYFIFHEVVVEFGKHFFIFFFSLKSSALSFVDSKVIFLTNKIFNEVQLIQNFQFSIKFYKTK